MKVRARCGETVTVTVETYHRSVWVSVAPSYNGPAIYTPEHVESLVNTLTQAAGEARSDKP
ncbi:MAG: hypothetical protein ACREL6_01400 [Gemmatimonadales bacterium]